MGETVGEVAKTRWTELDGGGLCLGGGGGRLWLSTARGHGAWIRRAWGVGDAVSGYGGGGRRGRPALSRGHATE